MVVSSACMTVAVIAQIVTMFRRRPGTALEESRSPDMLVLLRGREPEQAGQRPAMPGVDAGINAHAGFQLFDQRIVLVEIDAHRDPLHHLDEVAGGVLRR